MLLYVLFLFCFCFCLADCFGIVFPSAFTRDTSNIGEQILGSNPRVDTQAMLPLVLIKEDRKEEHCPVYTSIWKHNACEG